MLLIHYIFPAVNGEDSPAGQRAGPTPSKATSRPAVGQHRVRTRCVSPLRDVAGCASDWTRYLLALQSISTRPTAGGWTPGRYGPCHRPACPSRHGGQAHARQARVFDGPMAALVGNRPVEGVGSTMPTGGTPTHPQFSALSGLHDTLSGALTPADVAVGRIHARPEGRGSLLDSGSSAGGTTLTGALYEPDERAPSAVGALDECVPGTWVCDACHEACRPDADTGDIDDAD